MKKRLGLVLFLTASFLLLTNLAFAKCTKEATNMCSAQKQTCSCCCCDCCR